MYLQGGLIYPLGQPSLSMIHERGIKARGKVQETWLASTTNVCVLNSKGKVPRFLNGTIVEMKGNNTFVVEVGGIKRSYHKHQIKLANDTLNGEPDGPTKWQE